MKRFYIGQSDFINQSFIQRMDNGNLYITSSLDGALVFSWFKTQLKKSMQTGQLVPETPQLIANTRDVTINFPEIGIYEVKLVASGPGLSNPLTYTEIVVVSYDEITIVPDSMPDAVVGQYYVFNPTTNGEVDIPPNDWFAAYLPVGLSASNDPDGVSGVISGRAEELGDFQPIISVRDSVGNCAFKFYRLHVDSGAPVIIEDALPLAECGIPYSFQFRIIPNTGHAPLNWELTSPTGHMPAGLSFDSNTHILSGTPTAAEYLVLTLRVTDSLGLYDEHTFEYDSEDQRPCIAPIQLPKGKIGVWYESRYTLGCCPGNIDVVWQASGLPEGIRLDPHTAVLKGVPVFAGTFDVMVTARNYLNLSSVSVTTLEILP
jgi:PKD repeat protein